MKQSTLFLILLTPLFLAWCYNDTVNLDEKSSTNLEPSIVTWEVQTGDVWQTDLKCDTSSDAEQCKIDISNITWLILNLSGSDGKYFAEIQKVEFYTWDEATEAFAKNEPENCEELKKADNQDKCYPLNDYYMLKTDNKVSYEISGDAEIFLVDKWAWTDITPQKSTYQVLKSEIDKLKGYTPYYFEIKDNKIISIREQFIP